MLEEILRIKEETEKSFLNLGLEQEENSNIRVTKKIILVLEKLWSQIYLQNQIPYLRIKSRNKNNIEEHENGYFYLGDKKTVKKTLKTKGGSKELLKLTKSMQYILDQLKQKKTSTVREFFYRSLNWISDAQFEDVNEANYCIENLEILLNELRENLGVLVEADGCIYGPITVQIKNKKGINIKTHCVDDVGDSGFLLPRKFEDLKILSHDLKLILVIETGGFYDRLIQDNFHEKHNCLLVHAKGQSSRCVRRLIKYLSEVEKIPVFGFSDADTWGSLIINTFKRGSIKASHLSDRLCTPSIKHIGLLPSHIQRFELPCDNITKEERKMAELLLKDERAPEELKKELKIMLDTGKKAEQQGLAYWGTNYVSEVYLELILKEAGANIKTNVSEADIKRSKK